MATRVETPYTRRARYCSSAAGLNIKRPVVPAHVFRVECDRALDPTAPTGLILLDLSRHGLTVEGWAGGAWTGNRTRS
jgi:hypothetical protein